MAYLITHFWPGATEIQYSATLAVVHPPGGLPEDSSTTPPVRPTVASSSRPSGNQDQFDRFLHDKLIASMPIEGGFAGQPEERAAEIVCLVTA